MIERHLVRLRARHDVSGEEEAAIRGLFDPPRKVPARTVLIPAGRTLDVSTLLVDGLMCRFRDLPGGERQVSELHVPGDFADLHSFTLKRLDHGIQTFRDCVVAVAPHERIRRLVEDHPRLGRLYWFNTNLDAALHREWVVSLGRRDATARLAALFCELEVRLRLVGLADETGYQLRLTQIELAECVGLTPVHVNRVLKQLRHDQLLSFRSGRVQILDRPALRRLAAFDDSYLYLTPDEL